MIKFAKMPLIEICAPTVESAINASEGGADRIELCSALNMGGLTPSSAAIAMVSGKLGIPVFVLVRPRGGDFFYSEAEFECMLRDVVYAKNAGASGIVSGVLLKNKRVDVERTQKLIECACPLEFTFHRAFDRTPDLFQALHDVASAGARRILTSGGKANVSEGMKVIARLISFAPENIVIMPGGGIRPENVQEIVIQTHAREIHLSALALHQYSGEKSEPHDDIKLFGQDEISDISIIKKIRSILNNE